MSLFKSLVLASLISFGIFGSLAASTTPAHAWGNRFYWHHGYWNHGWHDGRMGWWWVVGPSWNYYARPYPQTVIVEQQQPPPPVTVIQQAPPALPAPIVAAPAPTLYYCRATGTYYPDTTNCPGGWSPQVAGQPPAPAQPPAQIVVAPVPQAPTQVVNAPGAPGPAPMQVQQVPANAAPTAPTN